MVQAPMTKHSAELRELILGYLAAMPPDAALLLSGGVDSATLLAGMLALGRRPVVYTTSISGETNPDAEAAAAMAATFGLAHHIVGPRRDNDVLIDDVRRIIEIIGVSTKTHVQVCHALLYPIERAVHDGHRVVLSGLGADDLWGTSRTAVVAYKNGGDKAWTAVRSARVGTFVSDHSAVRLAATIGADLRLPYHEPSVESWALGLRYNDVHGAFIKSLSVGAFPEFWERGDFYRRNKNAQIVTGIREWHDDLLSSSLNVRQSRWVVGVYNDILAGRV